MAATTFTMPDATPDGTVMESVVAFGAGVNKMVAGAPPKVTEALDKSVPLMTTVSPRRPLVLLKLVITGRLSTLNVPFSV